jgi:hypothetical protein
MKGDILAACISVLLLAVSIRAIRKKQLTETLAILWLGVSVATVILSILLPFGTIDPIAKFFGIAYPPDMVLVFGMLFLFLFVFHLSVTMSLQRARQKTLVQELALLKTRIELRETR